MANIGTLTEKYDKFVIFDTETTGLNFARDEIIEFSAVVLERQGNEVVVTREYDNLVTLSPGNTVPAMIENLTGISTQDILERGVPKAQVCADIGEMFAGNTVPAMIENLTGISTEDIRQRGIPKAQVCNDIAEMFAGNPLLLAYNAHFDLSFLFYLLLRNGDPSILKGKDKLDLLTVYKDRRPYPHKLRNAIDAYRLGDKVVNSHRAIDDVLATVAVMEAMATEKDDLAQYINLFGYNPKYGIDGKPIGSVTYKPQSYQSSIPLYQK